MNVYSLIGVCFGILVGVIICLIFYKKTNSNGKIRTEYDERQKLIRGKGYMYGYYSLIVMCTMFMICSLGEVELPFEPGVDYFIVFFVGIAVMCCYSVWNRAYWGLNTDKRKFTVLFIVCTVINLLSAVMACVDGRMIEDGKLQLPIVNGLCAVLFIVIAITIGLRRMADKKEECE